MSFSKLYKPSQDFIPTDPPLLTGPPLYLDLKIWKYFDWKFGNILIENGRNILSEISENLLKFERNYCDLTWFQVLTTETWIQISTICKLWENYGKNIGNPEKKPKISDDVENSKS